MRFSNKEEALSALKNLDGVEIRCNIISVKEAKFKRGSSKVVRQDHSEHPKMAYKMEESKLNGDVDGKLYKEVLRSSIKEAKLKKSQNLDDRSQAEVEKMKIVKGEICSEKVNWLNRSLVSESLKPIDLDILKEKLFKEWFYLTHVRAMGSYKCILMFET